MEISSKEQMNNISKWSNYHTHTLYCDGKNTPRELVEKALSLACPEIGFSGHSFTAFDSSYCMSLEDTEKYVSEIRSLQREYEGQIKILLGIEREFFSDFDCSGFDYVIGSLHYFRVPDDGSFDERARVYDGYKYFEVDRSVDEQKRVCDRYFAGDFMSMVEQYYENVGQMYEKTKCDIIGHFDLITKFNEGDAIFDTNCERYLAAVDGALDKLFNAPVAFEINTGAIARGFRTSPYPSPYIINRIREAGKKMVYNSDCHDKENLLFGFPEK